MSRGWPYAAVIIGGSGNSCYNSWHLTNGIRAISGKNQNHTNGVDANSMGGNSVISRVIF